MKINTKTFLHSLGKHKTEILTGLGIACMIGGTALTGIETPKITKILEEEKAAKNGEKLSPMETIKAVWKPALPVILLEAAGSALLIWSNVESNHRNAALTTAYVLSDSALKEYKEKVKMLFGEDGTQKVQEAIAEDHLKTIPAPENMKVMNQLEKGDRLCLDTISGRYFYSSRTKIENARNELNDELLRDMFVSLNEFYYLLGLDSTVLGEDLGWNIDDGLMDITFTWQDGPEKTGKDDSCLVINYSLAPRYFYGALR